MTVIDQPKWAFAALVTPNLQTDDGQLAPDAARMAALANDLLAAGCNGIVPFGTTGEGPCFSVGQRIAAVDALIEAGIAADRLVIGVGATALADMVALTGHAARLGCPVLAPPPFFLRAGDHDGIAAAYTHLIDQVGVPGLRMLLYNIPQISGFPLPPRLAMELAAAHPGIIVGIKDSAMDWRSVEVTLRDSGGLSIAVGVEPFIVRAMARGGRGTICGLANIAPRAVAGAVAGDVEQASSLATVAAAFGDRPFLPTLKAAMAALRGDPAWGRPMPPLDAIGARLVDDIVAIVRAMEQ